MDALPLYSNKYQNNTRTVKSGEYLVTPDDSVILVDTTFDTGSILHTTTLDLCTIPANVWDTQYKLYVADIGNSAATYPITILAPTGFLINGAQTISINVNGGGVLIRILNNTNYIAEYNNTAGGSITSIPVKNTVFIMKNGSDATGLVERFDKPFLTFAGARSAIQAFYTGGNAPSSTNRIMVRVYSGTYEEQIILDNFVDFDLGDSVISLTNPTVTGLITDNGVQVNSIIQGQATLYLSTNSVDSALTFSALEIIGPAGKLRSNIVASFKNIEVNSTQHSDLLSTNVCGILNYGIAKINISQYISINGGSASNCYGCYCANDGVLNVNVDNVNVFALQGVCIGFFAVNFSELTSFTPIITANVTNASGIYFQNAMSIETSGNQGAVIAVNRGKIYFATLGNISCTNTTSASTQIYAIASVGSSYVNAKFNSLLVVNESDNSSAIYCDDSEMEIYCSYITCYSSIASNTCCIRAFTSNTDLPCKVFVECIETMMIAKNDTDQYCIVADYSNKASRAIFKGKYSIVDADNPDSPTLNLSTVYLTDNLGSVLIFDDATLIGTNTGNCFYATSSKSAYIYSACQSNVSVNGNVTLLVGTVANGRFIESDGNVN